METNLYLTGPGAMLGFLASSGFAWQIHYRRLRVNLATWAMILILNFVGLGLLLVTKNEEPYIQISWCVAAILIFIAALLNRGDWKWGPIESWSVTACVLSVLVWVLTGSVWSLLGYVFATYVSIIPQVVQYWREERCARLKVAWVWALTGVAVFLTILGSPFTPKYMIVLIGFLVLNVGMTWLTLRRD